VRVAIYARVSTRDQEAANQLTQLSAFAKRSEWEVVHVYTDTASGGSDRRPEFQAMLTAARQRQFDVVLFWALDRLSREGVAKTLALIQQLNDSGVAIHSYQEAYLNTTGAFKDAILAILAALASQERSRISERTKAGMERAKADGKRLGRPPRAHWQLDAQTIGSLRKAKPQGWSWKKIADHIGVSKGTCQTLHRRWMKSVNDNMDESRLFQKQK
jgi:DNA invertase Pin-like site-specific DNA recombinase